MNPTQLTGGQEALQAMGVNMAPQVNQAPPATPPPTTPTTPQSSGGTSSLDPQVVAMAKAIRQNESNANYTEKGASGEYGAYQWMPATWAADSLKYLGQAIPFGQATPAEQDEVAYKKIADWKAAGYGPAQIASMWNAGGENPEAYQTGQAGTNSAGVGYDTPAYAKKVTNSYQKFISQTGSTNGGPGVGQLPGAAPVPGSTGNSAPAIPNLTAGQQVGDLAKDVGNVGVGAVKGIGQEIAGVGNPIVKYLTHLLGDGKVNDTATQAANQQFTTQGTAQQAGSVGAKILSAIGGAGAAAVGVGSIPVAGEVVDEASGNVGQKTLMDLLQEKLGASPDETGGLLKRLATSPVGKGVITTAKGLALGKAALDLATGKLSTKDLLYNLPELSKIASMLP